MDKEFIKYEQALALKELGFDEPCLVYWVFDGVEITFSTSHNKSGWSMIGFKNSQMTKKAGLCSAPLYQQAFRWFRQEHDLDYSILPESTSDYRLSTRTHNVIVYKYYMNINVQAEILRVGGEIARYISKEEAELACLNKLIELAKIKL